MEERRTRRVQTGDGAEMESDNEEEEDTAVGGLNNIKLKYFRRLMLLEQLAQHAMLKG